MPLDGQGQYRHNFEAARMHGGAAKQNPGKQVEGKSTGDASENVHEVVDHGDGTFTTRHPEHGEVHHETIGHMHAHLSKHHGEPGHTHFHAHHDGMGGGHSHHVETGGEPQHRDGGPEEMQQHLGEAMEGEPAEVARDGMDGGSDGGDGLY